jgi:hypothetical protein
MKHPKEGLNTLHSDTCVKVFDPELKKLIGIYPSYAKASNRLGIDAKTVLQKCASKNRVHSPLYGKDVACRLSKMELEYKEQILISRTKFLK